MGKVREGFHRLGITLTVIWLLLWVAFFALDESARGMWQVYLMAIAGAGVVYLFSWGLGWRDGVGKGNRKDGTLGVRMTAKVLADIERTSNLRGIPRSEWARTVLVVASRHATGREPMPGRNAG